MRRTGDVPERVIDNDGFRGKDEFIQFTRQVREANARTFEDLGE